LEEAFEFGGDGEDFGAFFGGDFGGEGAEEFGGDSAGMRGYGGVGEVQQGRQSGRGCGVRGGV
jgi:hypothetical protein